MNLLDHLIMIVLVAGLPLYAARPWAELGFSIQLTSRFWIVLAVVVGLCVAMAVQYTGALRTEASRTRSRASFGETAILSEVRRCARDNWNPSGSCSDPRRSAGRSRTVGQRFGR